jgi:hypothetical protein
VRQVRQGARQRGEIVGHHQRAETAGQAQRLDRKLPVMIGHAHHVTRDRVGDRQRGVAQRSAAGGCNVIVRQIGFQGAGQGRVRGARQYLDQLELTRRGFEGEARVRAADIGKQTRPIQVGSGSHGCRRGIGLVSHGGKYSMDQQSLMDDPSKVQAFFVVLVQKSGKSHLPPQILEEPTVVWLRIT